VKTCLPSSVPFDRTCPSRTGAAGRRTGSRPPARRSVTLAPSSGAQGRATPSGPSPASSNRHAAPLRTPPCLHDGVTGQGCGPSSAAQYESGRSTIVGRPQFFSLSQGNWWCQGAESNRRHCDFQSRDHGSMPFHRDPVFLPRPGRSPATFPLASANLRVLGYILATTPRPSGPTSGQGSVGRSASRRCSLEGERRAVA
jgi:hypothetical protein